MSIDQDSLRRLLADNDTSSNLREAVVRYRDRRDGGGGSGGGMEARVARLESDIEHVKRDVGELRTDMRDVRDRLTRIETRVDHLPSKGFVVTSVVITLAVLTAVVTFQDRIQQLVRQPSTIERPATPQAG